MAIYIYKKLTHNLDVEYKVQSFQPSTNWQECLVMTKCLDNVGWLPSLSQNMITCFRGWLLKASQVSQGNTGIGFYHTQMTCEREIYSHKSFRKSKSAIYPYLRKSRENKEKTVLWYIIKSNWSSSQIWLLGLAPSSLGASPSTTVNMGTFAREMGAGLI